MEDRKLSRDLIIAEALLLLQEEGVDGLSLRRLAKRLEVQAPSLYWHVPDKNALLGGMMEAVFTRVIGAVPAEPNWRSWMRSFGLILWQTQYEVRDFSRLIATTEIDETQFERTAALIRTRLEGLDLPPDEAVQLQSAVQALMTGWSTFAHVPYARLLAELFDLDSIALKSLDALIAGWPYRETPAATD